MGLGFVPEERRIFKSLTVLENLLIGQKPPSRPWPKSGAWNASLIHSPA